MVQLLQVKDYTCKVLSLLYSLIWLRKSLSYLMKAAIESPMINNIIKGSYIKVENLKELLNVINDINKTLKLCTGKQNSKILKGASQSQAMGKMHAPRP